MARIDAFLKLGREQGCSDVHLAVGVPPMLRMHGDLMPIRFRELRDTELASYVNEILTESQKQKFRSGEDLDFSYMAPSIGRFRVNVYRKLSGIGATFRDIPLETPRLEDLGLPDILQKLTEYHQGLILVTGSTGTGKSTTLAAMVDFINRNRKANIITLEDPVEFVHQSKQAQVIQREVETNVASFQDGLRAALREDPDVILVGELRDTETLTMAMMAAETGHLVLGTMHTTSAVKTIDRIIDALPAELRDQGKVFLSQNLHAVISQVLVKTAEGRGRKAIVEIMAMNTAISRLIQTDKTFQIPSQLQTGHAQGMQLMDQALMDAVELNQIDPDDAYLHATDKQKFQRFVTDPSILPSVEM
jgi:twitching motility protein PilT